MESGVTDIAAFTADPVLRQSTANKLTLYSNLAQFARPASDPNASASGHGGLAADRSATLPR